MSIGSILGSSMEHVGTMFQAVREHVDAKFSACMVVYVRSFSGEVCKHILNTGCSLTLLGLGGGL